MLHAAYRHAIASNAAYATHTDCPVLPCTAARCTTQVGANRTNQPDVFKDLEVEGTPNGQQRNISFVATLPYIGRNLGQSAVSALAWALMCLHGLA